MNRATLIPGDFSKSAGVKSVRTRWSPASGLVAGNCKVDHKMAGICISQGEKNTAACFIYKYIKLYLKICIKKVQALKIFDRNTIK